MQYDQQCDCDSRFHTFHSIIYPGDFGFAFPQFSNFIFIVILKTWHWHVKRYEIDSPSEVYYSFPTCYGSVHMLDPSFLPSRSSEKLLREKDQQISELLMEGEKLSKQQLTTSNVIKKLRSKDKENDSLIKTFRSVSEHTTLSLSQ